MDFLDRLNAHVRLAILLALVEPPRIERLRHALLHMLWRVPGRSATASFLEESLADYGILATRDEVVAELAWLARSRLVVPAETGPAGALVLDLGRDVARGKTAVPGVAPGPALDWLRDRLDAASLRLSDVELLDHLGWLQDRDLVAVDDLVLPTRLGCDVAQGRAHVEGVKPPSSTTIMRLASNAARDRLGG